MRSITTLFAFSPGRLPKKDENLLRKRQNGLNVYPWAGHPAENHVARACWTRLFHWSVTGHHEPQSTRSAGRSSQTPAAREVGMEQRDSSGQPSAHTTLTLSSLLGLHHGAAHQEHCTVELPHEIWPEMRQRKRCGLLVTPLWDCDGQMTL